MSEFFHELAFLKLKYRFEGKGEIYIYSKNQFMNNVKLKYKARE